MEPDDVKDYAKQSYWDARYQKEESYDWFSSIYGECVQKLADLVVHRIALPKLRRHQQLEHEGKEKQQQESSSLSQPIVVSVLHLGCGNSNLSFDLLERCAETWHKSAPSSLIGEQRHRQQLLLKQCAIDYSPVVIERMASRTQEFLKSKGDDETLRQAIAGWPSSPSSSPLFDWQVMDMRELKPPVKKPPPGPPGQEEYYLYDLVVDKGTMDALQADKSDEEQMERDIQRMLEEISAVMRQHSIFLQITWEVPHFRYFYTKREEFGWVGEFMEEGDTTMASTPYVVKFNNDMYRMIVYVKL